MVDQLELAEHHGFDVEVGLIIEIRSASLATEVLNICAESSTHWRLCRISFAAELPQARLE